MNKRAIFPPEFRAAAEGLKMSPGVVSGDHVFQTGVTGVDGNGTMPDDPQVQFRNCFEKIGSVLETAGLTFQSIVEMTSYHIGLREHFETFDAVRLDTWKIPTRPGPRWRWRVCDAKGRWSRSGSSPAASCRPKGHL